MRFFVILTLLIGLAPENADAEVAIKTYQAPEEGKIKSNQLSRVLRSYANLPGTIIDGPRKPFVVREIVFGNTDVSRLIATQTKGQSIRKIGQAIIKQTNCNIRPDTRVERISSFSVTGIAFFCMP